MFVKNSTAATVILRGITMPPNAVAEFSDELKKDKFFVSFVEQYRLRYVNEPATVNESGPIVKEPVKAKRGRKSE